MSEQTKSTREYEGGKIVRKGGQPISGSGHTLTRVESIVLVFGLPPFEKTSINFEGDGLQYTKRTMNTGERYCQESMARSICSQNFCLRRQPVS